jgi:hypothetical protein
MKFSSALILFIWIVSLEACPGDEYCRKCDFAQTRPPLCSMCQYSFIDSDGSICNSDGFTKVDNCIEYENNSGITCKACNYGFYPHRMKNSCVKCTQYDCAVCNEQQECLACFKSQTIEKTFKTCSYFDKCSDFDCEICQKQGNMEVCLQCKSGYSWDYTKGYCVTGPSNCLSVSNQGSGNQCNTCNLGYFIDNDGTCSSMSFKSIKKVLKFIGIIILIAIYGLSGTYCIYKYLKPKLVEFEPL